MKNKKNKGFTLTELIIVIVIIGILAAVLIPSISGYIKKAKISNDISDCKNMNTLLSAYAAENDINLKKLEAPEVRYIVSIDNKNYTFNPNYKDGVFWYNKKEGKIEYSSNGVKGEISADGEYTPESIEEIKEGYLYLNTKGDLANALLKLRNLTNLSDYNSLCEKAEYDGINISNILEKYNPNHTLFISSNLGYTDWVKNDENSSIQNVVFGDNVVIIPNNGYSRDFELDSQCKINIPLSVKVVMDGAFTNIISNNKIVIKNSSQKVQFINGSLSYELKEFNKIAEISMDSISKNIMENASLLSFNVKHFENSKDKKPSSTDNYTIEKDNGSYILKKNGEEIQNGINASGNLAVTITLDATINATNKLEIITNKLFSKYINVDALNIIYEVKNTQVNATIRAFDDSGMIINIILVYNK